MAHHTVTKAVSADADRIWALLRAFEDVRWIPVVTESRSEGEGPGMRRFLSGTGPEPVVERLVSIDEDGRTLTYSIDENAPAPITRWVSTASVASADGGGSTITWEVDFDSTDDEAAVGGIDMIYDLMAGWLDEAAGGPA